MPDDPKLDAELVVSYLTLRKAIGILGLALPFVLYLGATLLFNTGLQETISTYYYTGMRNVLVATMCAMGSFLLSYRGYERADHVAGVLASIFAVGIALFPTTPLENPSAHAKIIGDVHVVCATLFYSTLIYFCLALFTKTDASIPTRRKLQRNTVYRVCGYTIAACILLILVESILPASLEAFQNSLDKNGVKFYLESVAGIAFGISWLTKGEAILKDES